MVTVCIIKCEPNASEQNAVTQQKTQDDILRQMTPEQKLSAAMDLYWSARELKAAWLRKLHPDWSDAQIEEAVKEAFSNAHT